MFVTKTSILVILSILLSHCSNYKKSTSRDIGIYSSVINDLMPKASHGESFFIAPEFDQSLDSVYLKKIVLESSMFNEDDYNVFIDQYLSKKTLNITEFIVEKESAKFSDKLPELNEAFYVLSPVLYNKTNSYCIVNAKMFFWVNDEIKNNNVTFLFKLNKSTKEFIGIKKQVY